jgi:gamma-glutamyltranspeptidase/glutathione hydrolase
LLGVYSTEIGKEIIQRGGNAIDSAIAVAIMLTLTQPAHRFAHTRTRAESHSGIGGGLFLTFYDNATQTVHALDAREEAPQQQSTNITGAESGLLVGVPGVLAALQYALDAWGTGIFAVRCDSLSLHEGATQWRI